MESIQDRILHFINTQGIKVAEFERRCNFSNNYVKKIRKGVSSVKLEQIYRAYPQISPSWLTTGEGEMLLDQPTNFNNNVINITKNSGGNNAIGNNNKIGGACDSELIKTQAETIKQQQNTIEKLTEMLLNLTKK